MKLTTKLLIAIIAIVLAYFYTLTLDKPDAMQPENTATENVAPLEEQESEEEGERVQHYEAPTPETDESAQSLLNQKIGEIGMILAKPSLADSDLEKIHEYSYSLEAGVDKLREDHAYPNTLLDPIDEAVQALHYASENHEEAETRQWFEKLKTAMNAI